MLVESHSIETTLQPSESGGAPEPSRYDYLGIRVHRRNPSFLSDLSKALLHEGDYVREGETIPQALARPAVNFCFGDYELAQRIYNYAHKGWFMYASPVLSNATAGTWYEDPTKEGAHYWHRQTFIPKAKPQGQPISCFAFEVPDSLEGQEDIIKELARLSTSGGGTGAHNAIRATSKKAPGPIPFEKVLDGAIGYFKQRGTRKGALAYYMDSVHPSIKEHIRFRVPGGDSKRRSDNRTQFHTGVNLKKDLIAKIIGSDPNPDYELRCPHTNELHDTVNARHLWEEMLDTRALTGEPFFTKIDRINELMPETQKALGLRVNGSNLCLAGDTKVTVLAPKSDAPEDVSLESVIGKTGYKVLSYNTETKQSEFKAITNSALMSKKAKVLRVTCSETGKQLVCTPDHKVWTENRGYVMAKDLKADDTFRIVPETLGQIREPFAPGPSSIEELSEEIPVYDITVDGNHNFYANGVLVHNCTEITLPTDKFRTFVCCLSSLNLEKFDEWRDSTIVEDLIRFLDNVLQWFVDTAPSSMAKAKFSAERERALGLGAFGWHSYLQKHRIPFESGGFNSATQHTHIIFDLIKGRAVAESLRLGAERGEAPDMRGTGRRNSRLLAIAPNANSADIANVSPSCEPWYRNVFMKDSRAGAYMCKNPYLERDLEELGLNTKGVWKSILDHDGSVQHLEVPDWLKKVYKTAMELDQHWLVYLAHERGQYICQAQSLNLFFPPGSLRAYVNSVHILFLKLENVLTLYYYRTEREVKVDNVKEIQRQALVDWQGEECKACGG